MRPAQSTVQDTNLWARFSPLQERKVTSYGKRAPEMASMILSTSPNRRILQASQELAEAVSCPVRLMAGLDCANLVRCRNADGKPLCHNLCPALRAARARAGTTIEVPIWIEDPSGQMTRYDATFQRIQDVSNRMVVAFFEDPVEDGEKTAVAASPEIVATSPEKQKARLRPRPAPARKVAQLRLVNG